MTQPEVTQADHDLAGWFLRRMHSRTLYKTVVPRLLARHRLSHSTPASDQEPVAWPQHVAYFDDGEFHWMSGIAPRNCELYASPPAPSDRNAVLEEAANAVRDCMVDQEWPPQDGDAQIDEVLAAIRALRTEPAAQVEGEGK